MVSVGNGVTLTVNSGGNLTLGSSALFAGGTKKSIIVNNNGTFTITGVLEIWGDLTVNNNLQLNISGGGQLIVHGNVSLQNGAQLTVSGTGSLSVGGSFSAGTNAQITTSGSGTINVTGSVSLGNNGTIAGPPGSISVGGTCTCGNCSTQCSNGTVPISLLFFEAAPEGQQVALKWATASELNFDYFDVERSPNGIDFRSIGQLKGNGTTVNRSAYQLFDKNPLLGTSYYRLKSVDFDLHSETFKSISVFFEGSYSANFYPNPVAKGNNFVIELNFIPETAGSFIITDLNGLELTRGEVKGNETVVAAPLESGTYLVKITTNELSKLARILVP
ncbi:MAG: T9SS type A sorting domain-containing protein [Bacteroidetes bacterium]|nr:T9SS type A sorting domain-containing protein [Bacteroidota bacterium]